MAAKLSTLVKEARAKQKLTQTALAEQVDGLEQADVGKIERGDLVPSQAVLKRMAKPLGLTQKALLDAAGSSSGSAKTAAAAKKTSSSSAAKKTSSTSSARKTGTSTSAKTAAAKKTGSSAAKKTSSSENLKLTATEKKLVQLYRKADSSAKKTAINILEGDASTAELIGTLLSNKAGSSNSGLGSLLGSGKDAIPAEAVGTLLESALGKLMKK